MTNIKNVLVEGADEESARLKSQIFSADLAARIASFETDANETIEEFIAEKDQRFDTLDAGRRSR